MFRKILVLVRGADPAQPAVQRAALLAGRTTRVALLDLVHEPMLDSYMGNSAIYEPLRTRVVAERAEQVQQLVAALHERGLDAEGKAVWGHPLDEAVARRGPFAERRSRHHRTRFGRRAGSPTTSGVWCRLARHRYSS